MKRVIVFLTDASWEALDNTSHAEAHNRTDVINRAIQAYAAIGAARPGQTVTLEDADGPWKTIVVVNPHVPRRLRIRRRLRMWR